MEGRPLLVHPSELTVNERDETVIYDETPSMSAVLRDDGAQYGAVSGESEQELVSSAAFAEDGTPLKLKAQYRHIILVSLAMFMGYAILVSFQHKLKTTLNIKDNGDSKSILFGVAVSLLYIGNLVFRLMHNVLFWFIRPRLRVHVAMVAMMGSMGILGFVVFLGDEHQLSWVFIAYALGGIGIGSFESNLLSTITPLGHSTKVWAVVGFPTGFAMVLVFGFMLTALGVSATAVYIGVLVCLGVANVIFAVSIPYVHVENNANNIYAFIDNLKHYKEWAPLVSWNCLALMVDMYAVSLFSGVMLYIFNGDDVPLFGQHSDVLVPHDWFFVVYNLFTLAGDAVSRPLAYRLKPRNPFVYLLFSLAGAALCLSKVAIIAPIGIFFVFWANGSVYATSTRYIDTFVLKEYNLVTLSFWLFIGDIGSVAGSNSVSFVRNWVCPSEGLNMCKHQS